MEWCVGWRAGFSVAAGLSAGAAVGWFVAGAGAVWGGSDAVAMLVLTTGLTVAGAAGAGCVAGGCGPCARSGSSTTTACIGLTSAVRAVVGRRIGELMARCSSFDMVGAAVRVVSGVREATA